MWHLGTRVRSSLGSDGGTVGLSLRGLFQSKQFCDSMVKFFCNALKSVLPLLPSAAPTTFSLLPLSSSPEHSAHVRVPQPRTVKLLFLCLGPQLLPEKQADSGEDQSGSARWQQSFFAMVSSQQLCSGRTRGCARPTPTLGHLYWYLLWFLSWLHHQQGAGQWETASL